MKVIIEEVRKGGSLPYYSVSSENGNEVFTFMDDAIAESIFNKEKAFDKAMECAKAMKLGIYNSRKTILEL